MVLVDERFPSVNGFQMLVQILVMKVSLEKVLFFSHLLSTTLAPAFPAESRSYPTVSAND